MVNVQGGSIILVFMNLANMFTAWKQGGGGGGGGQTRSIIAE